MWILIYYVKHRCWHSLSILSIFSISFIFKDVRSHNGQEIFFSPLKIFLMLRFTNFMYFIYTDAGNSDTSQPTFPTVGMEEQSPFPHTGSVQTCLSTLGLVDSVTCWFSPKDTSC